MAAVQPATPSLRQAIAANGWEQAKLISPADTLGLLPAAVCLDHAVDEHSIGVVISQTCDLLAHDLVVEPYFDFIVAAPISTVDSNFAEARNPRQLDLPVQTQDGERAIRLQMRRRAFATREWLVGNRPSAQMSMPARARRDLVRWLRDRYARTALPDTFADRLKPQKRRCIKALSKIECSHHLMLALKPFAEVGPDQTYEVALLLTLAPADYASIRHRQVSEAALLEMTSALGSCAGVSVVDAKLDDEARVTMHQISFMFPFGYEYLSISDDPPNA